jgi:hypothetical protein
VRRYVGRNAPKEMGSSSSPSGREEPDAAESQRLLSIAEYWVRFADSEEPVFRSVELMKPGAIEFGK